MNRAQKLAEASEITGVPIPVIEEQLAQARQEPVWDASKQDNGNCILRKWTENITLRMQAVLMASVRGCDGVSKYDPSKSVMWALRCDSMNPSSADFDPLDGQSFMGYTPTLDKDAEAFLSSLDQYPFHFVMHLTHAAEIMGYEHPDPARRKWWNRFYQVVVIENLHCVPESRDQMWHRLRDR